MMPFQKLLMQKFFVTRWNLPCPRPWVMVVVAVFVFLAPNFDFAHALTWHDGQRMAQLGAIAAVLLTLLVPGSAGRLTMVWSGLPRPIRYALLTAFVLGLMSSARAQLPRWALLDWGLFLLLMVLGLSIAANRRALGERADAGLLLLFFGTATAYAVTTCLVYAGMLLVAPAYGQGFDIRELYTGFANVRFFGHVQTMLLPFLLLPAMWWGATRVRIMMLCSVPIIWWMLVVGSGTRGTWVALVVGVLAVLLFGSGDGRRWVKWQCAGLLCGFLCYGIFVLGIPQLMDLPASFLHRTDDIISLSLREVLWSKALDFALQQPLLGIGPMHYAYWANEVAAHPHNALLQWFAEWGLPAGLLLTGVWAVGGLSWAAAVRRDTAQVSNHGRTEPRLFHIALLAALTGASAQAMVDGVLVMPVSQVLFALLSGWALGMVQSVTQPVRMVGRAEWVFLAALVLFAVAAVIYGVIPEIGSLAERQQEFLRHLAPGLPLFPRFWALGWITD